MSKDARRPLQNISESLNQLKNLRLKPADLESLYRVMGQIADVIQQVEFKYGVKHENQSPSE
jgi:hypothetical protein